MPRIRFSLRTWLIGTAILGLLVAWIGAWLIRPSKPRFEHVRFRFDVPGKYHYPAEGVATYRLQKGGPPIFLHAVIMPPWFRFPLSGGGWIGSPDPPEVPPEQTMETLALYADEIYIRGKLVNENRQPSIYVLEPNRQLEKLTPTASLIADFKHPLDLDRVRKNQQWRDTIEPLVKKTSEEGYQLHIEAMKPSR